MRRRWAGSMAWYLPPASERTPPRSATEFVSRPPGSESSSTPTPTAVTAANFHSSSKISVWVIPTNEELMIARHTGLLLGLIEARV